MADNGYVYVLMNPSMNNLVKIGKTEREPADRAKELSATTGVPTPFIVVYYHYFESCSKAEVFVHTYLENDGYRVSTNREFFEIPINDAINAVIKAKEYFGEFKKENKIIEDDGIFSSDSNDDFFDDLELKEIKTEPYQEMLDIADNYYYGLNDEFIDYDEAMIYYLKAIKLGSSSAYRMIGLMYNNGEGVKEDDKKALKYFKEGVKKGDILCYAEMASLFIKQDTIEQNNIDNALKSWKKFFNSSSLDEVNAQDYLDKVYTYINFIINQGLSLEYKEKIYNMKEQVKEISKNTKDSEWDNGCQEFLLNRHEGLVAFVDKNL